LKNIVRLGGRHGGRERGTNIGREGGREEERQGGRKGWPGMVVQTYNDSIQEAEAGGS
jgi:hypothetical protein